jgi:hypothetical protein
MPSQFLTVWFDLRQPSAWKRQALDNVFDAHTAMMAGLLADCEADIERIATDGQIVNRDGAPTAKYNALSIGKCLPRSSDLPAEISSTLRDALVRDVAAMIASFLELRKIDPATSFPTAQQFNPDLQMDAARSLAMLADDEEAERELAADFMRRPRLTHQPLTFGRAADFGLLLDETHGRLFAWLPVLASGNAVITDPVKLAGNLIDVASGESFVKRSKISLLVPLEFGHGKRTHNWQIEKFIRRALDGGASIKTAKLCRMQDSDSAVAYRLYVSVAFETPEVYQPERVIGVAPGVLMSAAWSMVDDAGRVVRRAQANDGMASIQHNVSRTVQRKQRRGRAVSALDYRGRQLDELLHNVANQVIATAVLQRASVAMREMDARERPAKLRVAWQKFETIMQYKCAIAGVPLRTGVFGAFARRICVQCGEMADWDRETITCAACGHIEPALTAEAINTARRVTYRRADWEKRGGYRAFHRSFANLT